jgi:hypothetical protein
MEHSFPNLCLEQLVVNQSKEYGAYKNKNKNKNGMNQMDHKKTKPQPKPGQHAQPPLGSASETASGMPWKYLQLKIGQ